MFLFCQSNASPMWMWISLLGPWRMSLMSGKPLYHDWPSDGSGTTKNILGLKKILGCWISCWNNKCSIRLLWLTSEQREAWGKMNETSWRPPRTWPTRLHSTIETISTYNTCIMAEQSSYAEAPLNDPNWAYFSFRRIHHIMGKRWVVRASIVVGAKDWRSTYTWATQPPVVERASRSAHKNRHPNAC